LTHSPTRHPVVVLYIAAESVYSKMIDSLCKVSKVSKPDIAIRNRNYHTTTGNHLLNSSPPREETPGENHYNSDSLTVFLHFLDAHFCTTVNCHSISDSHSVQCKAAYSFVCENWYVISIKFVILAAFR